MTYEEKLEIVVKAIDEAIKITPPGYNTKLKITHENKLKDLDLDDTASILYQLQDEHRVIEIVSLANTKNPTGFDPYAEELDYFVIKVLDTFSNWKKRQIVDRQGEPERAAGKMTARYERKAMEKVWGVLQEVEELRRISPGGLKPLRMLYIPSGFRGAQYELDRVVEQRSVVLKKLEGERAIIDLKHTDGIRGFWIFKLGINYKVIFDKYEVIYLKMAKEYEELQEKKQSTVEGAVYEIKYTEKTREILINNFLMSKPDFSGENDLVFSYVYQNPNRKIDREEIEEQLKMKLHKTFHKILENLGFVKDYKKAFFCVSKQDLLFRNPVTRKDLDELGIKYLSLKI